MDCCDRTVYDEQFDTASADARLSDYRRNGPRGSTKLLLDAMRAGGVDGWSVLDIGGGVGAVHLELLKAGAALAVDADASGPYLAAARTEAERQGVADRVRYVKGDAVALAPELDAADAVTLDRVICCYGDMPALVSLAAARARRRLGIVLPREAPWTRLGIALINGWERVNRRAFRVHVHSIGHVLAIAAELGLVGLYRHRGWFWETIVLERRAPLVG